VCRTEGCESLNAGLDLLPSRANRLFAADGPNSGIDEYLSGLAPERSARGSSVHLFGERYFEVAAQPLRLFIVATTGFPTN
jgi:hypothetical protein